MKTNAIIRIILFSLALLVLSSILITALAVDSFMFIGRTENSTEEDLPMAADGSANVCVADPGQITDIEIEWAAGTIRIVSDPEAYQITVSETHNGKDKYNMVCSQLGSTLEIQFCKESVSLLNAALSKDLTVTVPESWVGDTLEIDAASANAELTDLNLREAIFNGASGECTFQNCQVDTLDFDGVSGDVVYSGILKELDFDAVSADFRAELSNTPSRLDFDGVSGQLEVTLPSDCGFTVNMDSLSGEFQSDFPASFSGDQYIYGDGRCRIELNGLSGSMHIRNCDASSQAGSCTDPNCTDASHGHTSYHQDDSHKGSSHEKDHH